MALHAVDLLTPRGRLNGAALWPGVDPNDIAQYIETYLTEGYAKAEVAALDAEDRDEPAKLWAYHRGYEAAYERLLLMPSTVATSDQGSASYLLTQMEHVGELASQALKDFTALVAALALEEAATYGVIRSYR